MIRARTGDAGRRPTRFLLQFLVMVGVGALAGCQAGPSSGPDGTPGPINSPISSGAPAASDKPPASSLASLAPTDPGATGATGDGGTPSSAPPAACSGSDANREFFRQAAASMAWPVYCAVLPEGWFLESGRYRLADGGQLEAVYRGPAEARFSLVEGNVCAGAEVDVCAPRDTVVAPAAFGDRTGALGRLANGLVLDVERGATPSWRATGLGLSEEDFRMISAALMRVP